MCECATGRKYIIPCHFGVAVDSLFFQNEDSETRSLSILHHPLEELQWREKNLLTHRMGYA